MEPRLFYYVNLVLCVIVFFEVLFTFRRRSPLKFYFLLVIASLFAMNYFACTGVTTRLQFLATITTRVVYVCSMMLAIVHLASGKTPWWLIVTIALSVPTIVGLRVYYYNEINIEKLSQLPNQVFTVGGEFYDPKIPVRVTVLVLAIVAVAIAFNYYRLFLMKMSRESAHYRSLSRWIVSMVVPFFLLIIFGILAYAGMINPTMSSYLFSSFNCIIMFSFLLRPRILNTKSYLEINGSYTE